MRNEITLRLAEGSMKARKVWVAVALALGVSGCVPDYVQENDSDIIFGMAAVNGGIVLQSDVLPVAPDTAPVALFNRYKNQMFSTITIPNHVILERYEVRYFRSDGRNVEGVDVPFKVTGPITGNVDVAISGTNVYAIEVVRAQAKLEAPLRQLRAIDPDGNVAPPGGALILTVFAEITVYGRTVSGQAVSASGRLQIDFADWE